MGQRETGRQSERGQRCYWDGGTERASEAKGGGEQREGEREKKGVSD